MLSNGELLTKTRSGRTFAGLYTGPEHEEDSVVIASLKEACDHFGQIVSGQEKTSAWDTMDSSPTSALFDVALAKKRNVSRAIPNEMIINT
ncbi:hypothetical protein ACJMK2_008074, partial [Sinanodonta woodiana]